MNTELIQSVGELAVQKNGKSDSILLLERDPGLRRSIALTLRQNGMKVLEARDNIQALEVLEQEPLALLVIDRDSTPDCGKLINTFREKSQEQANPVLLTTMGRLEDRWRQQYQPDAVIYKPFDIRYLYRRIAHLMA